MSISYSNHHQVKMADVVASVTAVLSQTALQTGLQDAVPTVLQRHLQRMAAEARQQLLPGPDEAPGRGADGGLPGSQVRPRVLGCDGMQQTTFFLHALLDQLPARHSCRHSHPKLTLKKQLD